MRLFLLSLVLIVFSGMASATTTGRGGLYFGKKALKHSDWGRLDSQAAWGIDLDVKDTSWPVWATVGYVSSRDEDTLITYAPFTTAEISGKTSEIQLGVKKDFFPIHKVRLSVAGGPAHIRASMDSSLPPHNSDSDSAVGFWLGADAFVFVGPLILGTSYKHSQATVDLFGNSVDAGGRNLAFSIGLGW